MLLQTVQDLDLNRQDDVESSKSENSYLGSNKLDELYLGVCCSILDELQLQKEKAKLKHTYACRRVTKNQKKKQKTKKEGEKGITYPQDEDDPNH